MWASVNFSIGTALLLIALAVAAWLGVQTKKWLSLGLIAAAVGVAIGFLMFGQYQLDVARFAARVDVWPGI